MKQLFLSLVALLLITCMLAACGSSTSTPENNDSTPTAPGNTEPNTHETTPTPTVPETPTDDFEFTAGDDGYTVTKYLGSDSVIVIPSLYDNKKVTDLDKTVFSGNIVLESITLSKHMTEIDLADFNGCDALTTVIYPGDTVKTKSYTGPANLTTLGLPGTVKITYDHHFSDIVKNNKKLTTLDFSGMESLYVNTFDGSCYEGLNVTVSDALYNELKNAPQTYHYTNIFRNKNEYTLTEFSLYEDFFTPDTSDSELVNVDKLYEYIEFESTGNQKLLTLLQLKAIEYLANYNNYYGEKVNVFEQDKLIAALTTDTTATIKFFYCYNPHRGDSPVEALYKNTDSVDFRELYEDYNIYDNYDKLNNMAAAYAKFTYEGKTYEVALTFKYGVEEVSSQEPHAWYVWMGENNIDNLILHCDNIEDDNCAFTTYFGCVSTITVSGTKYAYNY